MVKILGSLTSKFSMFQTVWDSVDPDRQNLTSLQERLIKEESKLNTESEVETALYTGKTKNSKNHDTIGQRRQETKSNKKGRTVFQVQEERSFRA
ncbi:hypothetical protein X777_00044 [Ooceraea biroi]|uniref:Uncharacterized protein n=1 Tax=Ooceraea biroi TaxID=2015173 RepID=A0A026VSC6_OOCBI|nr:hypothetical protein X777_00044 [Ooceraea biroi]